jgi:hypothetical protein
MAHKTGVRGKYVCILKGNDASALITRLLYMELHVRRLATHSKLWSKSLVKAKAHIYWSERRIVDLIIVHLRKLNIGQNFCYYFDTSNSHGLRA